MSQVTYALSQLEHGDPSAAEALLPMVYRDLRRLASIYLGGEKPDQTLQATALVHEAYLRLVVDNHCESWNSRGHFFSAAAEAMRRILIETARRKQSMKRGGGRRRCPLREGELAILEDPDRLLAMNDSIDRLAERSPEAAQLVKLRVFAGVTLEEAAREIGLTRSTAYRQWTYARAWLRADLDGPREDGHQV